jgi:predicted AAA+ superfamily ATPase
MIRDAEIKLKEWKDSKNRKPLLIYGARQVGKTWLMKNFGKTEFSTFIYINFEKEIQLRGIFEIDYNPQRIIKLIEIHTNQKIEFGKTLLILDEIQEAKGGLTALKYFNEELPELHLIGAGSLLGIALKQQTSFPVGQVEFLNLYPLNFGEFLKASGNTSLFNLLIEKDWSLIETFKSKYINLLKQYYYVGGMPEVVNSFIEDEDYNKVRTIQQNILTSYEQDFSKHAPSEIIPRIRMIWNSVISQLAKENKKFVYGLIKEGARAKDFELALSWLEDYGLIYKIQRTKKSNVPLAAYSDLGIFKLYVIDIGLLGALGNLNARILVENDSLFNEFKGSLTEQYVLQELIQMKKNQVHYWSNDSGSAEIDFIFEQDSKIIPLEVKAGENLQAKSLKTFSLKYPEIHCFRTSLSGYREESWLTNIPLYSIGVKTIFEK